MKRWDTFTLCELAVLAKALDGLANTAATETRVIALDLRRELNNAVQGFTLEAKQ